jgi:hypothetical protein
MSAPLPPLDNELLDAGISALEDMLLSLCDGSISPQHAVELIYKAMVECYYGENLPDNSCT